jgi:hypothetical protein
LALDEGELSASHPDRSASEYRNPYRVGERQNRSGHTEENLWHLPRIESRLLGRPDRSLESILSGGYRIQLKSCCIFISKQLLSTKFAGTSSRLLLIRALFYPEDGVDTFFRNVGSQDLHGATSQETALFIVMAVKTSNLKTSFDDYT